MLLEPVLDVPMLLDPVLDVPAPPVLGVPAVGLTMMPCDGAELDAEELGVVGLTLADADPVALDSAALVGVAVGLGVGLTQLAGPVPPGVICLLFAALRLAVESVAVGVTVTLGVTVVVAVPVGVAVAVAVPVPVPVPVPVGVPLLLVPPAGLGAELAGVTLGVCDLLDLAGAWEDWEGCGWEAREDGEELVGHAVAAAPLGLALLLPVLIPPFDEGACVPVPARLGGLLEPVLALVLCDEIPAIWPIWTMAWRVGGSASAMPMANTAAPSAKAGRSSPSRQSRLSRRACPASSRRAHPVFHGRVRPARKPPAAPALACLLARAGPALTRARIRSRPSGCGSTWSAAACSARRRNSPKSCPCGGVPSWPGLLITPAPGRCAGRTCRVPCDF
jgi:hypothetical protein